MLLRRHAVVQQPHVERASPVLLPGGRDAHTNLVDRAPDDPFQDRGFNYHYLRVEVDGNPATITMHRLDRPPGKAMRTQPDTVKVSVPALSQAAAAK